MRRYDDGPCKTHMTILSPSYSTELQNLYSTINSASGTMYHLCQTESGEDGRLTVAEIVFWTGTI